MCQACFEADAMFRRYLLQRPDERAKLTAEEAGYFGFRRDDAGQWVDAWPQDAWPQTSAEFGADSAEPARQ